MPVLAAEPTVYPDDLLTVPLPADEPSAVWHVLHTKPRQEKSLARELLRKEIAFYLPLTSRRWDLRGRVMVSHLPLFPGYLFLRAGRDALLTALSTRRVVRPLDVPDQQRLDADLRQVQRLLSSGLEVDAHDRLVIGQEVEITSGPLTGFRGRVLRTASGNRFVVEVDFIQRGASVLCDGMALRPLMTRSTTR
jgi:transcriptional antiterminator RfaH